MWMKGSKCSCGKIVVVDRNICPKCGLTMKPIELSNKATLLSHTTVFTVPEGFDSPIYMVLAELEKGVHLLCTSQDGENLNIGKTGVIEGESGEYTFVPDEN
jgi:uncharacterized OB-fold protein